MKSASDTKNPIRKIYNWTLSLAERKFSGLWLGLLSFAEASFFPIPPDVLLIPLCLGKMKKAFQFAFICSIASVLGGIAGYVIGAYAWNELSRFFFEYIPGFTPEKFDQLKAWYEEWGWPRSYRRFFTNPLQNIYGGKWRAGMALWLFILASAVVDQRDFSGGILTGKIW